MHLHVTYINTHPRAPCQPTPHGICILSFSLPAWPTELAIQSLCMSFSFSQFSFLSSLFSVLLSSSFSLNVSFNPFSLYISLPTHGLMHTGAKSHPQTQLSVLLQAYTQRHAHAHALVPAHDTLTHTYTHNAGLRRKRRTRAWMLRLMRRRPLHGQTCRYTTHPYTHTNSLTFSSFTYNCSYAHTHTHLPALPEGRTTGIPPLTVTMGVRVPREQSADWAHAITPSFPEDAE